MQMKKIFSLMFGFVSAIAMAAAFCFAGCANLFSFNGKFTKEERLVLDVGQELLPSDIFSSSKNVEFVAADENILLKNDTGTFTAQKSGKTSLVAKSGNLIIDTLDVYVKYDFQVPTNLNVTNDGLISWDESAVTIDGRVVKPTYKVVINGEEYDSPKNEYQLLQSGEFTVKVKANATALINGSAYSSEISFKFDMTNAATDVKFVSEEVFGSNKGTLSWAGESEGVLTIDSIQQKVSGNSKVLDFAGYQEKSTIGAKLYLQGANGDSKTFTKTITKLYTQDMSVKNSELSWIESSSIKYTLIKAENKIDNSTKIIKAGANTSVLEGADEGIYSISYQAIAPEGFANGNVKKYVYDVGKVSNVKATYVLDGSTLKVKFSSQSEFNKKFVVKQNSQVFEFEFVDEKIGGEYVLNHDFELSSGVNIFTVQAIPTLNGKEFTFGGTSTKFAIKSDEDVLFSAYNLNDITNLSHSTENGESILTFDNVEHANSYEVKINNIKVDDIKVDKGENQTSINIGKIAKAKYGSTNTFNIQLTATRASAPNQIVSPSQTLKTLTMLSAPVIPALAGEQTSGLTYAWTKDENAEYIYDLYLTDSTFDYSSTQAFSETVQDSHTKTLQAGYYVIKVRALPLDENNFLASEEISEDRFYVTEQIESPMIRLDYDESLSGIYSGYIVKIKTVEFGYEYKVLFGDEETVLGSVYNTNFESEELQYNLPISAELVGTKQIKVVAIAQTDALQKIHSNGTSVLTVEKLAAPSEYQISQDNTKITVTNSDSRSKVQLTKDGQEILMGEEGQNATYDITEFDGEFVIKARQMGYDEFEGYTQNGTTKIASDFTDFVLHRSQAPFNLAYNAGIVSFEHNDEVETYKVSLTVRSINSSLTKEFETTEKTFNLEEKVADMRREDREFDSCFAQKSELIISLYAYVSKEMDGKYYLPSRNATVKNDITSSSLIVSKLDPVELDFDDAREVIIWDGDESIEPVYEVYLGDELQKTVTTKSASGKFEFSVAGYDFLSAGDYKFYVIASSNNTLASDKSKNIIFHKLSQVEKLNVYSKDSTYRANFAFAGGDDGYVEDVVVNGDSIGQLPDFALNADEVSIVIKGKSYAEQNGDKIFFVSSDASIFTIRQLLTDGYEANVTISNKTISWQDYASSNASVWVYAQPKENVKYEIEVVSANGQKQIISNIAQNKLDLSNQKLLNLISGEYTFNLYAYISEYQIEVGGSGYYGKVLLQENVALKKLNSVSNPSINIDYSNVSIEQELSKLVNLSWNFENTATSDVSFEIYVNNVLKTTVAQKSYSLSQSAFDSDENTISIIAVSATDVASDKTEIKLYRYFEPQISISDRGVLTIVDKTLPPVSNGYIIEITMNNDAGESETNFYYTTERVYDLTKDGQGINGRSGQFRIRVIQKALCGSVNAVPSSAAEAQGIVLSAPTIIQDASGFTITSGDSEVTYYVKCEAKNFEQQVDGSHFNFPDDWESGEYKLVVYAQKSGAIDSWKGTEITVVIDRIENISQINFAREADYLDYVLSWSEINNATAYEIEIFKGGEKIGYFGKITGTTQTMLSDVRSAAPNFTSGEYVLSFRSLTNYATTAKTNSVPFYFNVSVAENTVENIAIGETGKLVFTSNQLGEGYYIALEETGTGNKSGEFVEDSTLTEYVIPTFTGKLKVSIIQVITKVENQVVTSQNGAFINSAAVTELISKLQNITSMTKDELTGKIILNVAVEDQETNRRFIVSHGGVEKNLNVIKNGAAYEFLAIDMVNLFDNVEEGEFEFSIITTIEKYARSDELKDAIIYRKHNNSSVAVKQDEINDYLLLSGEQVEKIAGGTQTVKATAIHITANDKKYLVKAEDNFGYWIEDSNEGTKNPRYFSKTEVTGANIKSTRCCAVNISEVLDVFNAGQINVRIGYVSLDNETFTVNNFSEVYKYKKLAQITALEIDHGNFRWADTGEENTGYVLLFDGATQHKTATISASNARYYLGEKVDMSEEFTAGIKVVSSQLMVLPSKITKYKHEGVDAKIKQLEQISNNVSLIDGVLKLDFNSSSSTVEKHASIESMLAGSSNTTDFPSISEFARQFIAKTFTVPFSFSLQNIKNVKFNLKFVKVGGTQSYYTSTNALNFLSSLSDETLQKISEIFTDKQITDERLIANLNNVYNMLTNKDYFTGIASSTLLFNEIGSDEIGEYNVFPAKKIPAGEYNIFIQQQGSAENNTISSVFKEVKSNVQIVPSPLTRVDSEAVDGGVSNVYYAKFVPLDGFDSYTVALRDKVTNDVIEYKVTKTTDGWVRSTFSGTNKDLKVENSFVWIPMNGVEGVIYDENVTNIYGENISLTPIKNVADPDNPIAIYGGSKIAGKDGNITIDGTNYAYTIANGVATIGGVEAKDDEIVLGEICYKVNIVGLAGHDFTVDIYANGDSVYINGKSETISVTFLKFNFNTLKLEDGEFVWENFKVNSTTYPSTVVTAKKDAGVTQSIEVKAATGAKATFTPESEGAYDYFKFFTKGVAQNFEIKVDSEIYQINNLYKLKRPDLKVINGQLSIVDNTAAADKRLEKDFILSNDVSLKKEADEFKTFNISVIKNPSSGKFTVNWQTGINELKSPSNDTVDHEYEYRLTEKTAKIFNAAVSGDSFENDKFSATYEDAGTNNAYYLVSIQGLENDGTVLLQSKQANVHAAKLTFEGDEPNVFVNDEGNIEWATSSQSVHEDRLPQQVGEGKLEVIYEVTVRYYYATSEDWRYNVQKTLYTSSNVLDAKHIVNPIDGVEFKYQVLVRANVYKLIYAVGDIQTIEGKYYNKIESTTYDASPACILDSELLISKGDYQINEGANDETWLISRTAIPLKDSFTIITHEKDGKNNENAGLITWKSAYNSNNKKEYDANTAFRIYAIESSNKTLIDGEVEIVNSGSADAYYIFRVTPGQLIAGKKYNFELIANQKSTKNESGEITSKAKLSSLSSLLHTSEDIQVLPTITASDYEILKTEENNSINFEDFFTKYKTAYGQGKFAIKLTDAYNEVDFITHTITSKKEVPSEAVFKAVAIPRDKNWYLRSDEELAIELSQAEWANDDMLYYDEQAQRFDWIYQTEFANKISNESGAEIYLSEMENSQEIIYQFGVLQGREIVPLNAETKQGFIANGEVWINYTDSNNEVVPAYVVSAAVNIQNGKAVPRFDDTVDFNVYDSEKTVIGTLKGKEYSLLETAFAVKAQNPTNGVEEYYYLPISVLNYDGNRFTASQNCPYYVDKECSQKPVVAYDTEVLISAYNVGREYQYIGVTNNNYLLKTTDVLHYLRQKAKAENDVDSYDLSNATFKISLTTTYSYKEGSTTYDITDTREYNNVPIGEIVKTDYHGIAVDSENGIRVTSFELPVVGKITKFKIEARKNENNLVSSPLQKILKDASKYEVETAGTTAKEYNFNLFDFGEGTSSSPYIIKNNTHFANINYRLTRPEYLQKYTQTKIIVKTRRGIKTTTTQKGKITETDTQYFFKQNTSEISAATDGFAIAQTFNGVYDGGNNKISASIISVSALEERVTAKVPSGDSYSAVEFTKGAGVFKEIGQDAQIKNLKLAFNLAVDANLSQNIGADAALVGGLVFKNLGIVDGITVTSSSVSFASALKPSGTLAVAPVVGENKATARNLVTEADVDITNNITGVSQNFFYGGLVGFNNYKKATIRFVKSKNATGATSGHINITFRNNTNGAVGAAGVVICAEDSLVDMALNTKDITITANGASAYVGGVVLLGTSAQLFSCVNTAAIKSSSAAYAGGIANSFFNSSVDTIVGLGTVNGKIDKLFAARMTFASNSTSPIAYTYSSYSPSGSFTPKKITKDENIPCKNNNKFQIQVKFASTTNFSADIVYIG